MEGMPPSTLATHGAMSERRGDAVLEDDCPYPPTPGRPWWLTILGLPLLIILWAFKWVFKQRLQYAIVENGMLKYAPSVLDAQQGFYKFPLLGPRLIRKAFEVVQSKVSYPPQHLMSSAPSNSPGILTVLKTDSKLDGQCKYKDILTSDDTPVLPAQPRIFRTVDGFGNCPYSPHIGQAAQPYSFVATCKKPEINRFGQVIEKKLPDTDDVFEELFKREEFETNEAGLNCLILDFATLLTHDLFNSHNGYNGNSSYADLSPLYGHDEHTVRRVRVFKRGLLDLKKVPHSRGASVEESKLKEFKEGVIRKLKTQEKNEQSPGVTEAQPKQPGCIQHGEGKKSAGDSGLQAMEAEDIGNLVKVAEEWNWDWGFVGWRALVEVFGREHNQVAKKLLKWYPDKFSHKFGTPNKQEALGAKYDTDGFPQDNPKLKGRWINDELLYQTARYITTRIYGNIVVTDYASNFLGLKELNDFFVGRPEKLGNSCSYEFGLLYHWHCLLPDETINAAEPRGVPSNENDPRRGPLPGDYYDQLNETMDEGYKKKFGALMEHQEKKIVKEVPIAEDALKGEKDKWKKVSLAVDHLPETELKLDDLLLSRYKTPIGRFGAFHTPKYMKEAEKRTMKKAREQNVGTYNDFRAHLGLMRCATYEEINPDQKVAGALRKLYGTDSKGNDNADHVELYPGVFAERSGRKGIKFGNILSIGLLEDALNLIRNDRLFVDFDAGTATAKGYYYAVTSHFADVIERNTNLKLVKEVDGKPVDYKTKYTDPKNWLHWRLASASLLTVPDKKSEGAEKPGFQGTVRKEIFKGTNCAPGILAKYSAPKPAPKPTVFIPPGNTSKLPAGSPTSHFEGALAETPGAKDY
ncbi:hypothetical protein KFL_002240030 [Klebsormidium nitens]|uniref:Uncharacterized protein n=1 Tax=Klebsormidium nitens TaxID=105231 RepID=A0A1Y1I2P8_KLENI|nr:hypothetical protein KFL_002240030 [Klebsormidium nitens]|eukprot:GAQ85200.1 hypothetical protein KFL_002240030 [Klebsormidium nitens]